MLRLLAIVAIAAVSAQNCGWTIDDLETTGSPFLNVAASGFNSKDVLSTIYYLPNKWTLKNVDYSDNGVAGETSTALGAGNAADTVDGKPGDCYNLFDISAGWGAIEPTCSRAENAAEITYTCKVEITIEEDLGEIRGEPQTREEIFELPIQVVFPKQVDAHLENLSVFDNPNNIAAIIYQEVDVNVDSLDVDATVRIFSSLQWPFKCDPGSVNLVSNTPGVSVAQGNHQDCADANAGDVPNAAPGDANACNQVWEILLTPGNDPRVCELDGDYSLTCEAICQPSWEPDCPLIQDDQGGNDRTIQIDYTLDSEFFCVQVVDQVDISASLAAYKDHDHTVPATNFILGQTVYFKATSTSGKATIVSTVVDHISLNLDNNMPTVFDQGGNPACDPADNGDTGFVNSLVVEDGSSSGNCEINVPTQANFQWLFCEQDAAAGCPFNPPVDGQLDFDVWVTLDITFKDVDAPALLEENKGKRVLLQQTIQDGGQQSRATASGSLAGANEDTSSASTLATVSAFVAVVVALAC